MWGIIALLIFAVIIIALYVLELLVPVALFVLAGIVLIIFVKFFLKKFEPYESALIYRFGRFARVSPSGWTIIIPGIERIGAVVDLREQKQQIDIPIISSEGLEINMLAVAYFYVTNAVKAVLNIKDYKHALFDLIGSRIRDLAAEFTFIQLLVNVEDIAVAMREQISSATENWGVEVSTFEIEKIEPPTQVMDALKGKRVAAEELEAKKFVAEARRIITAALGSGTKTFDDRTITYLYVKALENMKSAKMMVPAEFMDVVKPGGGKSNLAQGMIAGTTFNKALTMIGDEVLSDASLGKAEMEEKVEHAGEEEEKTIAGDSADGSVDGSVGD